jgi:hypothetical protein
MDSYNLLVILILLLPIGLIMFICGFAAWIADERDYHVLRQSQLDRLNFILSRSRV